MPAVQPLLVTLPDTLVGERVIVRPWDEADSDMLWDAIDSSREHLEAWMPWVDRYHNPDDALIYTRRARAHWLLRDDLPVAIVEKATGRILGGSGLHKPDWTFRLFEIGYWLRADAEGCGYATETVTLLTRMAFDLLDANRVEVRIDVDNLRSCAVVERLDFVLEGTLRRKLPSPRGVPTDMQVYALIEREYRERPWATAPST